MHCPAPHSQEGPEPGLNSGLAKPVQLLLDSENPKVLFSPQCLFYTLKLRKSDELSVFFWTLQLIIKASLLNRWTEGSFLLSLAGKILHVWGWR